MNKFSKFAFVMLLALCVSSIFAQPGSILINEIMYDDTSGTEVEWVELYNPMPFPRTLSNWVLTDGGVWPPPSTEGAIQIPPFTGIAPNGYLVIAKQPIAEFPTVVCTEIDASWALNNGGDNLALFDGNGPTAQLIDGSLTTQYPDLAATNAGNSIEKVNQNMPWDPLPQFWHESTHEFSPTGRFRHCTPGMPNSTPPCGTIEETAESNNDFGESLVLTPDPQPFSIRNAGTTPTCINFVGTYSDILVVTNPPPFVIPPGGVVPFEVTFTPPTEGDFDGVLWITQSDGSSPLKIELHGFGCKPVQTPPAPILYPATASDALQIEMPWDPQNGKYVQYAIEYSTDGFATSLFADFPFGASPTPVFHTPQIWAMEGSNVLTELLPLTSYDVRLVARDCMGNMAPGTSQVEVILEQLSLQSTTPIEVTIEPLGGGLIELQWDPTIIADNGRILQDPKWVILHGLTESSIDEILGTTTAGVFQVDISAFPTVGFFEIQAIADDVLNTPQPMIAWPPNGSRVAGQNTIVLSDFLHSKLWLDYTLWLDLYDTPVELGSHLTNPWNLAGIVGIPADFTHITPGPHTITARVNLTSGGYTEVTHTIEVVPVAYSNFDATYDPIAGLFNVDTTGAQNIWTPLSGILWQTSELGMFTGGEATFPWYPILDSLIIVNPFPFFDERVLTESPPIYDEDPLLNGAVTPEDLTPPPVPKTNLRCCCLTMTLDVTGTAEGTYGDEKNLPLGPVTTCTGGNFEVGYGWEMIIKFKWVKSDVPGGCYWGQDAKGDRISELVRCTGGPPPNAFSSLNPQVTNTAHKTYGGNDYPRDSTNFGNDDYRSDNNGGYLDESNLAKGEIRWWDEPSTSGRVPKKAGFGIRCKLNDQFIARADPDCAGAFCCKQWDVVADVTFCSDCTIITTTAPTLQNEVTPASCPGLAAN